MDRYGGWVLPWPEGVVAGQRGGGEVVVGWRKREGERVRVWRERGGRREMRRKEKKSLLRVFILVGNFRRSFNRRFSIFNRRLH